MLFLFSRSAGVQFRLSAIANRLKNANPRAFAVSSKASKPSHAAKAFVSFYIRPPPVLQGSIRPVIEPIRSGNLDWQLNRKTDMKRSSVVRCTQSLVLMATSYSASCKTSSQSGCALTTYLNRFPVTRVALLTVFTTYSRQPDPLKYSTIWDT